MWVSHELVLIMVDLGIMVESLLLQLVMSLIVVLDVLVTVVIDMHIMEDLVVHGKSLLT